MEQSSKRIQLKDKEWVVIGKILRSYGTNSKFHLKSYSRPEDNIIDYIDKLYVQIDDNLIEPIDIKDIRYHGKNFIGTISSFLQKEEIDNIYRGKLLYIPAKALPKPKKDEYYWKDLIGLKVINDNDQELGIVASMLEAGAHDVLMIEKDGKHIDAVPFKMHDYVKEVNLELGFIKIADW